MSTTLLLGTRRATVESVESAQASIDSDWNYASFALTMGWDGPMTVTTTATHMANVGRQRSKMEPVDVPLASHLRYDNPYAEDLDPTVVEQGQEPRPRRGKGVNFPLTKGVRFAFGGQALELDFDKGTRVTVDDLTI